MPGFHVAAIRLFSLFYYPIPIHSMQILIAFVKTNDEDNNLVMQVLEKLEQINQEQINLSN